MENLTEQSLMTYGEVAALLKMPIGTLYALVHQKRIPHVRLGRRLVRFRRSDVETLLTASHVSVNSKAGDKLGARR